MPGCCCFFNLASKGRSNLFRLGHWTKNFDANAIEGDKLLPVNMAEGSKNKQIVSSVRNVLSSQKIELQTPAIKDVSKSFGYPFDYAESYFNLKFALQELFKRPIDLLENKAIKNPYIRSNIDGSKSLTYARG